MNQKALFFAVGIVAAALTTPEFVSGQDAALSRAVELAQSTGRPIFGHAGTDT